MNKLLITLLFAAISFCTVAQNINQSPPKVIEIDGELMLEQTVVTTVKADEQLLENRILEIELQEAKLLQEKIELRALQKAIIEKRKSNQKILEKPKE